MFVFKNVFLLVPAYRKEVKIPDRVRGRGSEEYGSLHGKAPANTEGI